MLLQHYAFVLFFLSKSIPKVRSLESPGRKMERRPGGNCDCWYKRMLSRNPLLKTVRLPQLICRQIPKKSESQQVANYRKKPIFLLPLRKSKLFLVKFWVCTSVSLQPSSPPLRSAEECQRKVVTHTHTHIHTWVAGVGGLWQHIWGECWGIYLTGILCWRLRVEYSS